MKKRHLFLLLLIVALSLVATSIISFATADTPAEMKFRYGSKTINAFRYEDETASYYPFAALGTSDWVYYTDHFLNTGSYAEYSKNADYFILSIENTLGAPLAYTLQPAMTILEDSAYKESGTFYIGKNATIYLVDGKSGVRTTANMISTSFCGRYCYEIPTGFCGYVIIPLDALSADPSYDASSSAASGWSTSTKVFSRFSFWLTTADPTAFQGIPSGNKMIKGSALLDGALPEYQEPKDPEILLDKDAFESNSKGELTLNLTVNGATSVEDRVIVTAADVTDLDAHLEDHGWAYFNTETPAESGSSLSLQLKNMETGTYKASFINGTNYSEVLFTVEFHVTKLPASAEKPDGDVIIKYGDTEIGLFTIDSAGSYTDPIIPYVDIFGEGALSKQWRSTEYPKTYLADLQKSASYFAFAINNTSGSNLMLNWQPFVYLETAEINHCAFFTSESLAENNVWLVNKQGTRTAPEFSAAADNQNGRDLIIIPDGFDGYLILATSVLKGEQDILWDATAGLLRFNECFLAKENADGTPANTPDALSYISDFYALKTLPTYTGDKTDHTQTGDAAPQAAMMAVLVVLAFEALYILFRRKKTS